MRYDTLILAPLKDMIVKIAGFIPALVAALAVLIIGWAVSKVVTKLIVMFLRAVNFDHLSDKVGFTKLLKTGGIKHKPSDLFGLLTYWTFMISVLITAVKVSGLEMAAQWVDTIVAYVPHVFNGVLVLILGMLLAKFVSTLIYAMAKITDMPIPDILAKVSKYAIVVYVTIVYLKEVGFIALFADVYNIFLIGIIFAFALAFGLAGKDVAARYLDVLKKGKNGS